MGFLIQQKNSLGRVGVIGVGYVSAYKDMPPVAIVNLPSGQQKARFSVTIDSIPDPQVEGKRKYLQISVGVYSRKTGKGPFNFALTLNRGDQVLFGGSVWQSGRAEGVGYSFDEVVCDFLFKPELFYPLVQGKADMAPLLEERKYTSTAPEENDGYDF